MKYKIKWKAAGEELLTAEICDTEERAKERVRQIIDQYSDRLVVDVWNDDESWQIVTPTGVAQWCNSHHIE